MARVAKPWYCVSDMGVSGNRFRKAGATFGDLFMQAKKVCNATVLGLANSSDDSEGSMLNPDTQRPLQDGDIIYYMANTRLSQQQLSELLTAES